jgi:homoserine dehydrogenase
MHIIVSGFGAVSRALTELLRDQRQGLWDDYGLDVRIVGVHTDKAGSLYASGGLDLDALLALDPGDLTAYPGVDGVQKGWDAARMIAAGVANVLVEASPPDTRDGSAALDLCRTAFNYRLHVVLANPAPVTVAQKELRQAAAHAGRMLRYEATALPGTPCIAVATRDLPGARIVSVRGIFSAAANYMLGQMANGESYADALERAHGLGLVVDDPTLGDEEDDALNAAAILSGALFGITLQPEQIGVREIAGLTAADFEAARDAGACWKQVTTVMPTGAKVDVVRLPHDDPLAQVNGAKNAIIYTTSILDDIVLVGPRVGPETIAFSLLADLLDIHRLSVR